MNTHRRFSERLWRAAVAAVPIVCGAVPLSSCGKGTSSSAEVPAETHFVFDNAGCKRGDDVPGPSGVVRQAMQPLRAEDVGLGLQCIAWSRPRPGHLVVDLVNIDDACGPGWRGSAELDSDAAALRLRVDDPECSLAACGTCLYDWSFDVEGVSFATPLHVETTVNACANEQASDHGVEPQVFSAMLPLDTAPEGSLCRYTPMGALSWAVAVGTGCDAQLMPCGDSCESSGPAGSCGEGLECAPRPDGQGSVCQQPCTVDDDCALSQLSCVDGSCQIAAPWPVGL